MYVKAKGALEVNALHSEYPLTKQAPVAIPDFLANAAAGNASSSKGLYIDRYAGCAYAAPRFVPYHQVFNTTTGVTMIDADAYADLDIPQYVLNVTGAVTDGDSAGINVVQYRDPQWGHQTYAAQWDGVGSWRTVTVTLENEGALSIQGFQALLMRQLRATSGDPPWIRLHWTIGTRRFGLFLRDSKHACIRWQNTSDPIEENEAPLDDPQNWKELSGWLRLGESTMTALAGGKPLPVAVLFMNGTCEVHVGSELEPFCFPVQGYKALAQPVITAIGAYAQRFVFFSAAIHPMVFEPVGAMISAPMPLGQVPITSPFYTIHGVTSAVHEASGADWVVSYPASAKLNVKQYAQVGDTHAYLLTITNPKKQKQTGTTAEGDPIMEDWLYGGQAWSEGTAVCTRVTVNLNAVTEAGATARACVIPKTHVIERCRFDPNALAIEHSLQFDLDNFHGQALPWGWTGNKFISLSLGYANPATAYFPRFQGVIEQYDYDSPSGNQRTLTCHARDMMGLFESQLGIPPILDGWNHYAAMAFLAMKGGLTASRIAFASLVPVESGSGGVTSLADNPTGRLAPYFAAPGDPAPYYLPFGSGMNPWTPRDRMSSIRDLMDYVRRPSAYLLFFDAQGMMRYEPWIPASPVSPVKVFTEGATGTDGANLSEIWSLRFSCNTRDVHNQVLLIGVDSWGDSGWNPIISRREDTPSISAPPGAEPVNFVGWPRPFVWMDTRFADVAWTTQAADKIFEMVRIPDQQVTFTTWMQPQLYPMDVIAVQEYRSGASIVPFYVMEISNEWTLTPGGPQRMQSQIRGKFLR